jgi:hypothetical protein
VAEHRNPPPHALELRSLNGLSCPLTLQIDTVCPNWSEGRRYRCDNIRHHGYPFHGSLQTHIGTWMPYGGNYIIKAPDNTKTCRRLTRVRFNGPGAHKSLTCCAKYSEDNSIYLTFYFYTSENKLRSFTSL